MNQPEPVTTSWSTKTHWIIAITALCLLGAAFAGYFYHRYQMSRLSSQYLRLIVSGPSAIHLDMENRFEIRTLTIEGKPIAAEIQFIVRKSASDSILEYHENVPKEGLLDIVVDGKTLSRAKLGNKPNDWVEIVIQAVCQSQKELYSARIPIAPEYWLSQLQTSKIGYSVDEPMVVYGQVRQNDTLLSWPERAESNGRYSGFEVLQQSVDSLSQGRVSSLLSTKSGVSRVHADESFFRFQLDSPCKTGKDPIEGGDSLFNLYELTLQERIESGRKEKKRDGSNVLKSRQYAFWYSNSVNPETETTNSDDSQEVAMASDSSQVEFFPLEVAGEQPKASPLNVVFVPEGGRIIADLDNRVYFISTQNGQPRSIQGKILDADGKTVALTESNMLGIGSFEFFPRFNTQYWFVSTESQDGTSGSDQDSQTPSPNNSNAEINNNVSELASAGETSVGENEFRVPLPNVLRTSRFTVKGKRCVLQPDETEVTFTVQSNHKHLPLVAELEQRGAGLIRVPFFTQDVTTQVSLPLPESFCGFGKVTIYDYSNSRPIASVERVVFRHARSQFTLQTEKKADSLIVSLLPAADFFRKNGNNSVDSMSGYANAAAKRSLTGRPVPQIDRHFFLTLTEPSKTVDFDFANLPSELYFNGMATLASPISLDKIAQTLYSPELPGKKNKESKDRKASKQDSVDEGAGRSSQILDLQESVVGLCRMTAPRTNSNRIQSRTYPLVYDNFPALQTRLKTILRDYFSSKRQTLICATSLVLFLGLGLEFFVLLCWLMGLEIGSKVHLLALVVCVSSVVIAIFLSYSPGESIQDQNRFVIFTPPTPTEVRSSNSSAASSETDSRRLSAAEIQYLQDVEKIYRVAWEQNQTEAKTGGFTKEDKTLRDGLTLPKVYYSQFGQARFDVSPVLSDSKPEMKNVQDNSNVQPIYRWTIPLKEINPDRCWIRLDLYGRGDIQSFYQPINISDQGLEE